MPVEAVVAVNNPSSGEQQGKVDHASKRILFLVSSMQGGGAERVASILCNDWAAQGHDVTLIPTFSGRGSCLYPLHQCVKIEYLADRVKIKKQLSIWNQLRRLLALRRMMVDERPDVVVSFLTRVNIVALIASVGFPVRVVVSERNHPTLAPIGGFTRLIRRCLYRWADTVVVQTNANALWFRQHCRCSNTVVIPNPVIISTEIVGPALEPRRWVSDNRKIVLGVGRLTQQKGFGNLVRAFSRICQAFPNWDLVILGEGELRAVLEHQRDASGLKGRVHFPGRTGNIDDWYRRADVFVLSSLFEGFPNTLLEAMAHGLAVVSSDCENGPRDILRHGETGLVVPIQEGAAGLAGAMQLLMADDEQRHRFGRAALEVKRRFSVESVRDNWLEALGLKTQAQEGAGTEFIAT